MKACQHNLDRQRKNIFDNRLQAVLAAFPLYIGLLTLYPSEEINHPNTLTFLFDNFVFILSLAEAKFTEV